MTEHPPLPDTPAPDVGELAAKLRAHASDDEATAAIQDTWRREDPEALETANAYRRRSAELRQAASALLSASAKTARLREERDVWKERAHSYELQLGNLGRDLTKAEARAQSLQQRLAEMEKEKDFYTAEVDRWHASHDELGLKLEEAEALLAEAREVIAPFAEAASIKRIYSGTATPERRSQIEADEALFVRMFTNGHLRAAAAFLLKLTPTDPAGSGESENEDG